MRDDPGKRIERVASKEIPHGHPAVEGGLVGFAAKSDQPDRFVRPTDKEISTIAKEEVYVLFVGGSHDIQIAAGWLPVGAKAAELIYIDPADNKVKLEAEAEEGDLPLGVLESIDTARTPDFALINTNALNAFMAVPAEA
jgi:hypothetical protein